MTRSEHAQSLTSFPDRWHFSCVVRNCCWGSSVHPMWVKILEAGAWFPLDTSMHLFPLLILCLFAAINQSHKYNDMLSPVSPPWESWKLGVGLGPLNTPLIPDLRRRWCTFSPFMMLWVGCHGEAVWVLAYAGCHSCCSSGRRHT